MSDQMDSADDIDAIKSESQDWDDIEEAQGEPSIDELNDWGGGELEAAYLKALSALEASESEMPSERTQSRHDAVELEESDDSERTSPSNSPSIPATRSELPTPPKASPPEGPLIEVSPKFSAKSSLTAQNPQVTVAEARPTPRQIIEACLFVGGDPLTTKKLSGVLRGEFDSEYIDREIEELNRMYAAQCRPYEIRLVEGGFRFALREEFERIRHKVYGLGPKEVRLSQEALEVLAVVAYHQPIKQTRVEELGKPGCGAVLRQLVRRELIAVERDPGHPRDVNYVTTPRFLSLFGIRHLDELPRHEQVTYK